MTGSYTKKKKRKKLNLVSKILDRLQTPPFFWHRRILCKVTTLNSIRSGRKHSARSLRANKLQVRNLIKQGIWFVSHEQINIDVFTV